MKRLITTVIGIIIAAYILSSCTQRTCPTYANDVNNYTDLTAKCPSEKTW